MILTLAKLFGAISELNVVFTYYTEWIAEYHQSRTGLMFLQQEIDDFMTALEAQLEQERKAREAQAAEGDWTVVVLHKEGK
uniref:Uncharacterized protein n=1 Tax=Quercus lobata TaxID=97700 RepID=A0A7N2LW10_QUELO